MSEPEIEILDEPHEYRWNGAVYASVTTIIGAVLGDGKFSRVSEEVLEAARERGKLVHEARRQLDNGDLDWDEWVAFDEQRIQRGEEPILPRVRSYMLWRDETGFIPMESEKPVLSVEFGFAGRLDIKGLLFGKRTIVDTKSGPVGDETALQTAGYAIADGDVTVDRIGLRLFPDGRMAKPRRFDDPFDYVVFKSFLAAYKWMEKHGF